MRLRSKKIFRRPRQSVVRSLLLASSLLLTHGCASRSPTQHDNGAESADSLSRPDRVEIFEGVWQEINDNYYDPSFNGTDWPAVRRSYRPRVEAAASDAEFYRLLQTMLSELRDSHTSFFAPAPPGQPQRAGPRTIGVRLAEAEGSVVISEVEPGSDAERGGVRAGMILRAVNGKKVEEHFAFLRSVFVGMSSERGMKALMLSGLLYGRFLSYPRRLVVEDFEGGAFEVELSPSPGEPPRRLTARRLPSGLGYIKFGAWQPPVEEDFGRELATLADAPGLIIDLRGNGGGRTEVQLDIAGNFFPSETYFGTHRTRAGELIRHFTKKQSRVYEGRVVILVDEGTASASETFSVFMQEAGRALVVGRPSAGSTLNMIGGERHFKDGGKLLYSTQAYVSPAGRNPEGTGVVPDEIVPLRVEDLRRGRDAALERAEGILSRP